jgi:hypothetical protein
MRAAIPGLLKVALFLLLAACGADARYIVIGSARAPSASGIVELEELDGSSTLVTVHLEYLHPPAKIDAQSTTYVVWFAGPTGAPLRAGTLRYNPEARTGDLTATSPFDQLTVKVTAERDGSPPTPSSTVIATQSVRVED